MNLMALYAIKLQMTLTKFLVLLIATDPTLNLTWLVMFSHLMRNKVASLWHMRVKILCALWTPPAKFNLTFGWCAILMQTKPMFQNQRLTLSVFPALWCAPKMVVTTSATTRWLNSWVTSQSLSAVHSSFSVSYWALWANVSSRFLSSLLALPS